MQQLNIYLNRVDEVEPYAARQQHSFRAVPQRGVVIKQEDIVPLFAVGVQCIVDRTCTGNNIAS